MKKSTSSKKSKILILTLIFILFNLVYINMTVFAADEEAAIGEVKYSTIEAAITAATEGSEVEIDILKDIEKFSTIFIPSNKNIKLDLNGYVIRNTNLGTNISTVSNGGTLTVIDSSDNKTGEIKGPFGIGNNAGADLTIISGNIISIGFMLEDGSFGGEEYDGLNQGIRNEGNMIMEGGVVIGPFGISNTENSTLLVKGGKISVSYIEEGMNTAGISNRGEATILDGEITGTTGVRNEAGILTVLGGEITASTSSAINNYDGGVITVRNGKIVGTSSVAINNVGEATIEGGEITSASTNTINNREEGILIIKNGKIEGKAELSETGTNYPTIYNSGEATIEDGKISAANAQAVYNGEKATLTVKGGTIESATLNGISNYGTSTVEGGEIIGYKYSIYNVLTLSVLDGKFSTTNTESGITIYNGSEGKATIAGGRVTGRNGINNYGEIIITNVTITNSVFACVNFKGTMTITGGTITGTSAGIQNGSSTTTATLVVEGGTITGTTYYGINNYGEATIKNGEIIGYNYGIYNRLTLTILDGNIESTNTESGVALYNYSNSNATMTGGTLSGRT